MEVDRHLQFKIIILIHIEDSLLKILMIDRQTGKAKLNFKIRLKKCNKAKTKKKNVYSNLKLHHIHSKMKRLQYHKKKDNHH